MGKGLPDLNRDAAQLAAFRAPPVRPAAERLGIYPEDGAYFFDEHTGTFRVVYERGHLPTPGAMAYAYMSKGQSPESICGPGFDIQGPGWSAFQPRQAFSPQTVQMVGVATRAGQVITAPLFVPDNATASARGV